MNIDELERKIRSLEFAKHRKIFFAGDRNKFVKLVGSIPNIKIISTRDLLVDACMKKNIDSLDGEKIKKLVREIIPRDRDVPVALVDNELFIKYGIFHTTLMGTDFQDRLYLIHVSDRHRDSIKNEQLYEVG